jgi:DNA ligase-1
VAAPLRVLLSEAEQQKVRAGSSLIIKGMTQKTLEWQTHRFLELETNREGITVFVRPTVVAEIALDGVQASTRYPGGVTLRFARLKRYREDKSPAEADTIESVRVLLHRPDAQAEEAPGHP